MLELRHDEHAYDHIMFAPRHVSDERPHMSNYDRAAQFAPFAALTGFDSEIEETGRLTESRPLLDEDEKQLIDRVLRLAREHIAQTPSVSLMYFVPDMRKQGGAVLEKKGRVVGINEYFRTVLFEDGAQICIDDIVEAYLDEPLS